MLYVGAVAVAAAKAQRASRAKCRQVGGEKKLRQRYTAAITQLVKKDTRGVIGVAFARTAVENGYVYARSPPANDLCVSFIHSTCQSNLSNLANPYSCRVRRVGANNSGLVVRRHQPRKFATYYNDTSPM